MRARTLTLLLTMLLVAPLLSVPSASAGACHLTATQIDFGQFNPLNGTALQAVGYIAYRCSMSIANVRIALSAGQSNNPAQRSLTPPGASRHLSLPLDPRPGPDTDLGGRLRHHGRLLGSHRTGQHANPDPRLRLSPPRPRASPGSPHRHHHRAALVELTLQIPRSVPRSEAFLCACTFLPLRTFLPPTYWRADSTSSPAARPRSPWDRRSPPRPAGRSHRRG